MSRNKRVLLYGLLGLVIGAMVVVAVVAVIVQSDWFKNLVRERIISVTENATGGRVEIGRFDYDWRRLTVEIAPFVLHGKEPRSAAPLLRAEKIEIGLKTISVLERNVDIALLSMEKPEVHLTVGPDGTTNLPTPKAARSDRSVMQQILDLKVRNFAVHNGFAEYNERRIPLDLQGRNLNADVRYEPTGPCYTGEISLEELRGTYPKFHQPIAVNVKSKLALDENQLRIVSMRLSMPKSSVDLGGAISNLAAPRGDLDVSAHLAASELNKTLRLPVSDRGEVDFKGKATFSTAPVTYQLSGKIKGRRLDLATKPQRLDNLSIASNIEISPGKMMLQNADVEVLNGSFRGSAEVRQWRGFTVSGVARKFPLPELVRATGQTAGDLNGTVSGNVRAEGTMTGRGVEGLKLQAKLDIAPAEPGVPVEGSVDLKFDQRAARVELGDSALKLGSTQLNLSGTLGDNLKVHLTSANLQDLLPAFSILGREAPKELPVTLKSGTARFDGSVAGPLDDPRITGNLDATHFLVRDQEFDRVAAGVELTKSELNFHALSLDQGELHAEGNGRIGLVDWKSSDASPVVAALTVRGADLEKLVAGTGAKLPASGTLSASLNLSGTLGAPEGDAQVRSPAITAYDEQLSRVRADLTYSGRTVQLSNGSFTAATGHITVKGAYTHAANDWKTGQLVFNMAGDGLMLAQIKHVQDAYNDFDAQLDFKANGSAAVSKNDFDLSSFSSQVQLRNAVVDGRPYGNAVLTANTDGTVLSVKGDVDLRGTRLQGSGKWTLSGDYPGEAQIQIPRVTVATLHDLAPGPHVREKLPFDGYIEGSMRVSGPLKHPDAMKANVNLTTVQINADPSLQPFAGAQAQDLVLRNSKPVVFEATTKIIDIKSAEFTGKDTTVQATGRMFLDSKNPWDVSLSGNVSLAALRIFNPDMLGSGNSLVQATIRGPLTEPQIDGRLEVKNASLFLKDVPSGVTEANGVILFDRNRATVQSLAASIGGGRITFQPGSFVGFRGTALLYRLQAEAANVRYRSPEGVSITVSAVLNLNGTSENSLLSGTVTIERAGFNPRTDVGGLLASTEKPISASTVPNELLRGIQFDVRVVTAQSLEVQTSMTRDVQAEANLRVRGNLEKPVVLGNISVSSGQIEFFGNKYTISHGEISFFNPSKIDPILNMDLETRVRGITVDITFSGPLNKLNFSYRSDPPFDSNQILALLAVGRDPTATGGLASTQTITNTSYLATGTNALLGQAISPANGGLERLFGVSHIKIDPQFTDISTIPQARLTLEQQISKDVTLTYITNLTRTTEQIVRVQVDLNRRWSVIALRDENGAFGIDVQYRRRFK